MNSEKSKNGYSLIVVFSLVVGYFFITNIANANLAIKNAINNFLETDTYISKEIILSIEKEYNDAFAQKNQLVTLNGIITKILDEKELNGTLKLENGLLTNSTSDKLDMASYANNMIELNDYLSSKNIEYMHFQAPNKVPESNEFMPRGRYSYARENVLELLEILNNNDVPYIDFEALMVEQRIDHYNSFFINDIHWNNKTAFWAHEQIVRKTENILGSSMNEELFDINRYNEIIVKGLFLGSAARKTGRLYAGIEDYKYYVPDFRTNMHIEIPGIGLDKTGTFQDVLINNSIIDDYKIFDYGHSSFFYDNQGYVKITNLELNNNKKIFLIKDSFGINVAPFLALHYEEVHFVDLRLFSNKDMLAKLDEIKPDIVATINGTEMFDVPIVFEYLPQ